MAILVLRSLTEESRLGYVRWKTRFRTVGVMVMSQTVPEEVLPRMVAIIAGTKAMPLWRFRWIGRQGDDERFAWPARMWEISGAI
jgi:hypothetical protein